MESATSSARDNARTVSEENLEIVRRLYDAMHERGATAALKAALDFIAPDGELELFPPMPRERYRGPDEIKELLVEWDAIFGDYRLEPEDYLEASGRVVVLARFKGKGASGGVPVDIPMAHIWTLSDGVITRAQFFTDRRQALEVAGLPA